MIDKLNSILNRPFFLERQTFINAFIATLSQDEVINLIELSIYMPFELRRAIVYRVQKDIEENYQKKHNLLLNQLFKLLDNSKGNIRNKTVYCIIELLKVFPVEESTYFIKKLLDSQFISIRYRAYTFLKNHWTDEYKDSIKDAMNEHKDIEAARLFINKSPISYLESSFEFLDEITLNDSSRIKLYLRLLEKSPSIIDRLKDEDPANYIYLRFKANRPLTHQEALKLFYKALPTKKTGIMIWAIGKMGLRKTLEELLLNWDEIEKEISKIYFK